MSGHERHGRAIIMRRRRQIEIIAWTDCNVFIFLYMGTQKEERKKEKNKNKIKINE